MISTRISFEPLRGIALIGRSSANDLISLLRGTFTILGQLVLLDFRIESRSAQRAKVNSSNVEGSRLRGPLGGGFVGEVGDVGFFEGAVGEGARELREIE